MVKKLSVQAMALGFSLALSAGAQASFLSSELTPNILNGFEDNSREAAVDVNRNGIFDTGDVLIGFIRIDNKSAPNSVDYNNNVYAIFSQQMVGQNGPFQLFAPTVTPGLRLSDVVPGAAPTGIAAIYSGASISDLIVTAPGTSLTDYFNAIKAGLTLDLVAGFRDATDFLVATSLIAPNFGPAGVCATANPILCGTTTDNYAFYTAGLSILQQFGGMTAFTFADDVSATNPLGASGKIFQLGISGGNATGASDDPNVNFFGNASTLGAFAQCGASIGEPVIPGALPCGFRDNADFGVHPLQVPEPATLALLGAGLVGLGFSRRRKTF